MKNNFLKTSKYVVFAGVLVSGVLILAGIDWKNNLKQQKSGRTSYIVSLTDSGFKPGEIKITVGDTVIFKNQRNSEFWPTSDPHPTHTDYPEFDPKKQIAPLREWSFQFLKTGTWQYHDHLNSVFRGKVIVSGKGAATNSAEAVNCTDNVCWDKQIDNMLRTQGIEDTFALVAKLYIDEPNYGSSCHSNVHKIGQKAYGLYRSHESFILPSSTSYCGYSFYHGFMEGLFETTGNFQEASDFCQNIGKYMKTETDKAKIACLHGIGHGLAEDGLENKTGSPQSAIDPSLKVCEKVGSDDFEKELCATGVFNALTIVINSGSSKLQVSSNDPYLFCSQQATLYQKKACYQEFATYALTIAKGNFAQAAHYVELIEDNTFALPAMENLAASSTLGQILAKSHDDLIKVCHTIMTRLQEKCLDGIAGTLLEQGTPGQEYLDAFRFCKSGLLKPTEQDNCFKTTLSLARSNYTPSQYQQVCLAASEKYRDFCKLK